ncbi:hypothetical protein PAHAL_4G292300 [Panicum hallii]|uniref:Uncharacterized protein n=1 Tax=Panicum hallii TaxID=206008 RepID=A0A2S3HL05_9POAL|nr:hypothetical protein PAHAL_4G292300 [Panicum hallii]
MLGTGILIQMTDGYFFPFFRPQLTSHSSPTAISMRDESVLSLLVSWVARRRPNSRPDPGCCRPPPLMLISTGACASWRYLLLATGSCFRPAFARPCHSHFVPAPAKCQCTFLLLPA